MLQHISQTAAASFLGFMKIAHRCKIEIVLLQVVLVCSPMPFGRWKIHLNTPTFKDSKRLSHEAVVRLCGIHAQFLWPFGNLVVDFPLKQEWWPSHFAQRAKERRGNGNPSKPMKLSHHHLDWITMGPPGVGRICSASSHLGTLNDNIKVLDMLLLQSSSRSTEDLQSIEDGLYRTGLQGTQTQLPVPALLFDGDERGFHLCLRELPQQRRPWKAITEIRRGHKPPALLTQSIGDMQQGALWKELFIPRPTLPIPAMRSGPQRQRPYEVVLNPRVQYISMLRRYCMNSRFKKL